MRRHGFLARPLCSRRVNLFNALNCVTHEGIGNATAGEISNVAYAHDGNGHILTLAETIGSVTRTATRRYDVLDRLSTDADVHHKSLCAPKNVLCAWSRGSGRSGPILKARISQT